MAHIDFPLAICHNTGGRGSSILPWQRRWLMVPFTTKKRMGWARQLYTVVGGGCGSDRQGAVAPGTCP
jgi:hypothetical protein